MSTNHRVFLINQIMENQFEKLEELIKDDDKIVTVVSLAQISKISLQESQELINKYVKLHKGEIYPTYILNGTKKETGDLLISQVNNENIEEIKKLYENEPKIIIFSIQRAKSIDYNVISLVQPKVEDFVPGQIVGKNCFRRVFTKKILPTLPASTVKGKSTIFAKQNSVKSEEKVKPEEDKNDTKIKQAPAKGTIANMFKGAQNKKPVEQKPKKTGGLSNFLTKQPKKEEEEIKQKSDKDTEEIEQKSEKIKTDKEAQEMEPKSKKIKSDKKTEEIQPKQEKIVEENIKKPKKIELNKSSADLFDSDTEEEILKDLEMQEKKPAKKQTPKNKRKKTEESSNEKSAKKRKRIIVEESDSSDDMFGGEKSDNEEPVKMEIEPEPVKVAPVPKNKRRKAVKKMFEDEEGFIVTEIEYVYETASEDENVPENIEKKKSNSEPEISPNKGKKLKKKAVAVNQPTLMNFFKKK